jgi:hypothetical protein
VVVVVVGGLARPDAAASTTAATHSYGRDAQLSAATPTPHDVRGILIRDILGAERQSASARESSSSVASPVLAAEDTANAGGGVARTLFHYTDEAGQKGILDSGQLNPSLRELNPADARYGNGQYLSDIQPGTMTSNQLSRTFLGAPFWGSRFTNFVEIDVSGLDVVQGRAGVYLIPNEEPLDLTGRIVSSGSN